MSEKITLEVELARDLAYSDAGDTIDGYTVMLNEQIDTRRWESVHRLVIRDDETRKFYFDTYRVGLTESQDTGPWEYDKEATFHEVFAAPKVTTVTDYVSADKVPAPEPEPSDPRQIAAELIQRQAGHIGKSGVRMRLAALNSNADIGGMPDEALVTTVHDLIRTAEITWPEVTT